jgi:predicted hotdog family 3-hydroxylacyl-ACP dehydratase
MEQDRLPAEGLIPHRHRMRLIDWVKRPTQNNLQAETIVTEAWPLYNNGQVSSIICIELVAQAISALNTWRRGEGAKPRAGLLVGIKEAEFSKSSIPVGARLHIEINVLSHLGNYAVFEGKVRSDSDSFCKIIIQVLEPEETLSDLKKRQKI